MPSIPLRNDTIPSLIDAAAQHFGDTIYLGEGEVRISFNELRTRTRQVATALIARGIEKGDRIAIWAPNIYEWVIAAYGLQSIGAVLVTLNTRYKRAEAGFILRKSGAKLLFCIDNFLNADYPGMLAEEELPALNEIVLLRPQTDSPQRTQTDSPQRKSSDRHTSWQAFLDSGSTISAQQIDARAQAVHGDDTADILFTSGTTGAPKGVMAGHGQNLRTFRYWADVIGLQAGDRYLIIGPFFHSFGYKAGLLTALMCGCTALPQLVFDTEQILKRIQHERINVMPGPPTLFQSILAFPNWQQYDISSLQRAATGAAAIPVELIRQMREILKIDTVISAYGLTECCGTATMCHPDDDAETIAKTSGRAIEGTEVKCIDSDGNAVPCGEPGEIVIRGYNVMQGYFENPQATADTIDKDGWLHTGDVGVLDTRGNLRITDRLKDMFITGGFNVYPAEIENILATHPQLAMTAAIGIPDERMGEVCMVWAVKKAGGGLTAEQLIQWCRDNMANYKVPRRVEFVDALPLNASGKVLKTELRARIK
ncbi:MAG TPA: FadD3 family acyl-CoA ligase [Spongiibacteraceae bacterium]